MSRWTQPGWLGLRRVVWAEVVIAALAILLIPSLIRLTAPVSFPLFFVLGLNELVGVLAGGTGTTDVGWEVASSRGLADAMVSAYAPLNDLAVLIGMSADDSQSHSHPPTSLPLGLPLAFLPYSMWIGSWAIAMLVAMAASLRLMNVPAWVAYPVALGLGLTNVGQNALTGTYPIMAVALALAWRYRDRPVAAGLSYAAIAASRGIGGLLLLYPLARRQWRVIAIAVGTLVALMLVSLALEPSVVSGFLDKGRASIEYNLTRPMTTPYALFEYVGLPGTLAWVLTAVVAGVALWQRKSLFWILAWVGFAITPIAWAQSFAMTLPLFVVMWRSGRLGAFLSLLPAITLVAGTDGGVVVDWPVLIAVSGLALMLCPITDPHDRELRLWPRRSVSRESTTLHPAQQMAEFQHDRP